MKPLRLPGAMGRLLGVGRTTVGRLVDEEGMPAIVLREGPSRRVIRFDEDEVVAWIKGRRARQIAGTLNGHRFTRHREEEGR